MLLSQLIISTILIGITCVMHAVILDYLILLVKKTTPFIHKTFAKNWKALVLTGVVLGIFVAHGLQIWLWTVVYLLCGALDTFEAALYFSTSTFSTVGYGDLVLSKDWRLLAALQSVNGFILFGWSAAFIFEIMSQLYKREAQEIENQ